MGEKPQDEDGHPLGWSLANKLTGITDRETEVVHGDYQTSSVTPGAAQRLWPKLGQACRCADLGCDFW